MLVASLCISHEDGCITEHVFAFGSVIVRPLRPVDLGDIPVNQKTTVAFYEVLLRTWQRDRFFTSHCREIFQFDIAQAEYNP